LPNNTGVLSIGSGAAFESAFSVADILHKLNVRCTPERIYRALVERDELAGWWTRDVRTDGKVGSVAEFGFGPGAPTKMRIAALDPSERVVWRCTEGPREWIGTEIRFSVTAESGSSCLRFAHCGWAAADDFFAHCNFRWAHFLRNLRAYLEEDGGLLTAKGGTEPSIGVSRPHDSPCPIERKANMSNIHQEVTFPAAPSRIYQTLIDTKRFAEATGAPASGESVEGGAFSAFGGHVTGRHVELVADSRVVQAWRAKTWPEGVYSIVRFELHSSGAGTRLVFDHDGFPDDLKEHLSQGWRANYWDKIATHLA
jgi:uncharacterized protein YndB with AHSA1/START domain